MNGQSPHGGSNNTYNYYNSNGNNNNIGNSNSSSSNYGINANANGDGDARKSSARDAAVAGAGGVLLGSATTAAGVTLGEHSPLASVPSGLPLKDAAEVSSKKGIFRSSLFGRIFGWGLRPEKSAVLSRPLEESSGNVSSGSYDADAGSFLGDSSEEEGDQAENRRHLNLVMAI